MNQFMRSHPMPQRKASKAPRRNDKATRKGFSRNPKARRAHQAKPSSEKGIDVFNQFTIDQFIKRIEAIATRHFGTHNAIVENSQAAERIYTKAGSWLPQRGKNEIVGSYYADQARSSAASAYDQMTTEHDKLLQKAYAEEAAPASADQLASIEAFFKTDPSAQSIASYYERNSSNLTCAKLILSEAAKRKVILPKPPALVVIESREKVTSTLHEIAYNAGSHPVGVYIAQLEIDLTDSSLPTGSWLGNEDGTFTRVS